LSAGLLAQDYHPPRTHQYSLNIQVPLGRTFLVEIGYVGTRGKDLVRHRTLNQAQLASPSNPIRGVTTNTVANIPLRVPFQGWQATGLRVNESAGESWYDGLEASLTKRFSRGLQFLASYTWAKSLDTDAANFFSSQVSGTAIGDNNDPASRKGLTEVSRPHRFVFSYVYEIPGPSGGGTAARLLGGWAVSGVTTIQSGQWLTLTASSPNNVYGITTDRVQIAANCSHADLVNAGSVKSKLTNYFNRACFAPFPIVGDDGRATGFGNSGVGIVRGPHQQNFDLVVSKRMQVGWFTQTSNLELRIEMFNAFNTVQFNNPVTNFTSPTFGQIQSTSVSPRIMQLAAKFTF
jgi:hypothetical protein